MKRKILALIGVMAIALCSLCACFGTVADEGKATVVIENRDGSYTEYKLDLGDVEDKSEGAASIIEYLAAREENPLEVDMQNGSYGKFVNSIGGLTPDTMAGEFISVYTSVEADFGTFADVGEIDYNGTLLKSAGVGLSSMQVNKDTVILFRVEVSNW